MQRSLEARASLRGKVALVDQYKIGLGLCAAVPDIRFQAEQISVQISARFAR
jgi:hypothetical protein